MFSIIHMQYIHSIFIYYIFTQCTISKLDISLLFWISRCEYKSIFSRNSNNVLVMLVQIFQILIRINIIICIYWKVSLAAIHRQCMWSENLHYHENTCIHRLAAIKVRCNLWQVCDYILETVSEFLGDENH